MTRNITNVFLQYTVTKTWPNVKLFTSFTYTTICFDYVKSIHSSEISYSSVFWVTLNLKKYKTFSTPKNISIETNNNRFINENMDLLNAVAFIVLPSTFRSQ